MSESTTDTETFDVFLCHNSEDKPDIRNIARQLTENGIKPWLDEEQIRPGTSWQTAIGDQINSIKSAAIFVGESGLGPWQDQEIQALLSQFVKRKCPVIPVILSSAKETPKLPWTLQNLHWVDFRAANLNPLKQLIWGITGEKPDKSEDLHEDSSHLDSDIPHEIDLFPPKEKKVIELRLSGDLDEFTDEAKMVLLESLNKLMNIGDVKLTRLAAGSVRLYLELDPEDADKLYSAEKEGRLADLGISEARLYPAIATPPEAEQRAQLLVLLDRVNEYWIDGVLKHSLYNEVLISLGKHTMDEAVEPPWKHFLELPDQRRHLILKDRSINSVFDATGLLLILGEPGSGKTTTLLDLASSLIYRAKEDPKERAPIVLNLSSWKKKQTLAEWIAEELSAKYRVPVKIGRSWLKNDYILPLLDGLDEVQTALRPACVAAINEFIDEFEPSGLVVCCRLMEYQWLPERLKLNGAICLELLGSEEVGEFLAGGGKQLAGLREAMRGDPVLRELSQTPLMLSIMSLAFEGFGVDDLSKQKTGSTRERREQIFNLYVERMFTRKELINTSFTKDKVIGWLARLAKGMKEHSQSVFMVEELQPSWLNTKAQKLVYGTVSTLVIALSFVLSLVLLRPIFGTSPELNTGSVFVTTIVLIILFWLGLWGCWSESPLRCGFISALVGGLIGGLNFGLVGGLSVGLFAGLILGVYTGLIGGVGVGSLKLISPIETLRWHRYQFWGKAIHGLKIGAIIGLVIWLSFLLVGDISSELSDALIGGLIFVVAFGLIGGSVNGLLGGMTDKVRVDKSSPNQGIYLSLKNAVLSIMIVGLIFGLIFGLISGLVAGLSRGLNFLLGFGLIFGLFGGLNRGGSAVVKHYSLRFILWIKGYTPFKFIRFLDYCAKLILLKKVGGGYMFIHRMLLEHFAKMDLKLTEAGTGSEEDT
jgi:hypothetical protein